MLVRQLDRRQHVAMRARRRAVAEPASCSIFARIVVRVSFGGNWWLADGGDHSHAPGSWRVTELSVAAGKLTGEAEATSQMEEVLGAEAPAKLRGLRAALAP